MTKGQAKDPVINVPTYLTIIRIVLSIVFMVFILLPHTWAKIVALILFVIAAVTDKIDGYLARKNKQVTDLGAFLDPLADKILVNLALLALVYLGAIPIWVFAVILVRDLVVDGMRMMAARQKVTVAASFLGKLKTTVQLIALIIIVMNLIVEQPFLAVVGNIALYLALILTIVSGFDYTYNGYQRFIKKSMK